MKFERIIFLDFDGVIVTQTTRFNKMDPLCMTQLKRVIDETDAWLVISSTWRHRKNLDQIKDIFTDHGFEEMGTRVIGLTPILNGYMIRGREIEKWIIDNEKWDELHMKSFIILDDDSDMEPFMDRLIKTDRHKGMNEKDAVQAINMLKGYDENDIIQRRDKGQ